MGDDLEELLPMLVAASKDERLSTGALYSRAASMLEGMSRDLAVQTALLERAVELMNRATMKTAVRDCMCPHCEIWLDEARAFLAEIRRKKPCEECDGTGRWYDASHSASRHCKTCDGTGEIQERGG